MKVTFIQGGHGTGKYRTALKIMAKSKTTIIPSWNGTLSEIGSLANYETKTLILHGVYFPEHENNIAYLIDMIDIPLRTRNGYAYRLKLDHLIVCTSSYIPKQLQTKNYELIETDKKES